MQAETLDQLRVGVEDLLPDDVERVAQHVPVAEQRERREIRGAQQGDPRVFSRKPAKVRWIGSR